MRCPHLFHSLALNLSLAAAQVPDARQLLAHSDDPLFTARTARVSPSFRTDGGRIASRPILPLSARRSS